MNQQFGDFIESLPPSQEFLIVKFSPSSLSLRQRWRNNGLSADFMADYFTTFFPQQKDNSATNNRQTEIKSAVSYIANELIENAMKYNEETSQQPVSIQLHLNNDRLVFISCNSMSRQSQESFQRYIKKLLTHDSQQLYMRQLERNVEDETKTSQGLGYLTMLNDYQAKLGWKFESISNDSEIVTVTTMVQLAI